MDPGSALIHIGIMRFANWLAMGLIFKCVFLRMAKKRYMSSLQIVSDDAINVIDA